MKKERFYFCKLLVSSKITICGLCCLVALVLLVFTGAAAQDLDGIQSVRLSGQAGFIIAHKPEMRHVAQSHPLGAKLDFAVQTRGKKDWQHVYNFPVVGLSVSYLNMGAPRLLGEAFALSCFLEPVIFRTSKSKLSYQVGTGLVYITQPFDIETNYTNIAISSALSFALQAGFNYAYLVDHHYYFTTALNLIHYSNGAVKMPNAGLNILSLSIGLGYNLSANNQPLPIRSKPSQVEKKLSFEIIGAGGLIENAPLSPKAHGSWTLSAYTSQRLSRKNAVNVGVDGFYNLALKAFLHKYPDLRDNDFRRLGLAVGHELMIHRLSLLTQAGYYLYMPSKVHSRVYQRYGLRYRFYNNYFGSVMLKSHLGRAEMVEWGIGVRL